MMPGHSRTLESLRLVRNFSMELTSELAMNPQEDSVPFGPREPIISGVWNPVRTASEIEAATSGRVLRSVVS